MSVFHVKAVRTTSLLVFACFLSAHYVPGKALKQFSFLSLKPSSPSPFLNVSVLKLKNHLPPFFSHPFFPGLGEELGQMTLQGPFQPKLFNSGLLVLLPLLALSAQWASGQLIWNLKHQIGEVKRKHFDYFTQK